MKTAGKKNNGAWFRANKAIHNLDSQARASLGAILQAIPTSDAAFNALVALAAETGVDALDFPANKGSWIARMMDLGIPLQIWMGKLTFTTYTKTIVEGGDHPGPKYTANYTSEMHYFAKDLRQAVGVWLHAQRQMRDVFDIGSQSEGNPGGQPDSVKVPAGQ